MCINVVHRMQVLSTTFRMRIGAAYWVRVVYKQVLSTTFRMRIDAAYWVRVVYTQVLGTTFRMPVYYLMNVYLFVSAFITLFI